MNPGWPVVAGFHHVAWPLGTPAWQRAELHTTAAKTDRQVEKQRDRVKFGERWRGRVRKEEKRGEKRGRTGNKRRRKGRHE